MTRFYCFVKQCANVYIAGGPRGQGYTPFRRDRVGRNGGGVFIAVRNDIIVQGTVLLTMRKLVRNLTNHACVLS